MVHNEKDLLRVRRAELGGRDDAAVGRLVYAYLAQTEAEKGIHLGTDTGAELPQRYRAEIANPEQAYAHSLVYLAELDTSPVGVVIVQESAGTRELKRVWVDPSSRGLRAGSALLDAALGVGDVPARLTVWDWREDAIRLYRTRGFTSVPSWEERPRLMCMERPARTGADPR